MSRSRFSEGWTNPSGVFGNDYNYYAKGVIKGEKTEVYFPKRMLEGHITHTDYAIYKDVLQVLGYDLVQDKIPKEKREEWQKHLITLLKLYGE